MLKGPRCALICGWNKLSADIEFEEVDGWNKKSDDGLEEKLGGNVVFGDKIEAGNDFGERLLDNKGC